MSSSDCSLSLTVCVDCTKDNRSRILEQLLNPSLEISDEESNNFVNSNLPPPVEQFSDQKIVVYPLRLDTKYYSVDLGVCKLATPTVGTAEFAERVEAIVFHAENLSNLTPIESWLTFVKHWETDVRILIVDRISDDTRGDLTLWCVKNEFELVELNPDDETRQEAEECGEVFGVRRVLQILKAHSWRNLELKDENVETQERSKRLQKLLGADSLEFGEFVCSNGAAAAGAVGPDDLVKTLNEKLSVKNSSEEVQRRREEKIDALVVPFSFNDDKNAEKDASFEELFEKFATFKANADNLPAEQRKAYAEKVTLAFWRAIGGDADEIAGLSSDGEEDGQSES